MKIDFKLPNCPICDEDELHPDLSADSYRLTCLSCGWSSGIQTCREQSLLQPLMTQLVVTTAAGYDAVANRLLARMEPRPAPPLAKPTLTRQQHSLLFITRSFADTLRRGTIPEQHTAALLDAVVDAVTHGYEAELVALVRAWRIEREREG